MHSHHYSSLFGRLKADQCKACELQRSGIAPFMSTLCLPDLMHMPSSSVFAYCKRSKNWKQEWPGNEASLENSLVRHVPRITANVVGRA